MNAVADSGGSMCFAELPNSTSISTGPISIAAVPWKSGPSTMTRAPMEIEMVISPNSQVSMVTPAAMLTYALTLKWNGSK